MRIKTHSDHFLYLSSPLSDLCLCGRACLCRNASWFYQAFILILALVFLTLGSLLTAFVVSHSTTPASNNILYLGSSLLTVGGLVLALSISLLVMRLSKTHHHHREAKHERKLKRSPATFLRPFSSSQQSGLDAMTVPKIIISRSASLENPVSPFRIRHKVIHDLGTSYESLVPRPFSIENEDKLQEEARLSEKKISNSVIPIVSVIML